MTSKGQVTIPASIRKHFGLQEGQKFDVRKSSDGILFVPQAGWAEVFDSADKVRAEIDKKHNGKKINWDKLKEETDRMKTEELRQKYFGDR